MSIRYLLSLLAPLHLFSVSFLSPLPFSLPSCLHSFALSFRLPLFLFCLYRLSLLPLPLSPLSLFLRLLSVSVPWPLLCLRFLSLSRTVSVSCLRLSLCLCLCTLKHAFFLCPSAHRLQAAVAAFVSPKPCVPSSLRLGTHGFSETADRKRCDCIIAVGCCCCCRCCSRCCS